MKDRKKVLLLTQAAVIAALYAAMTFAQEMLLPGSASMAVQFRVSEALMLLCVLTPAAIPGVTLGCFVSNLLILGALPFDMIIGTTATLISALIIYKFRKIRIKNLPVLSAAVPAIINGIFIGAEIEIFFIEGSFHFTSFLIQALLVAAGEAAVCFTLGLLLFKAFDRPQFKRFL